jgi:hypothetical protein
MVKADADGRCPCRARDRLHERGQPVAAGGQGLLQQMADGSLLVNEQMGVIYRVSYGK